MRPATRNRPRPGQRLRSTALRFTDQVAHADGAVYLSGRKRAAPTKRHGTRTALYLRVSTAEQKPDLQYDGLRGYAGAKLIFLPPYSPDLNPIEQAFSQLKTLLRKENARTIEQTTNCIGKLLDHVTPKAASNYFREAGYST